MLIWARQGLVWLCCTGFRVGEGVRQVSWETGHFGRVKASFGLILGLEWEGVSVKYERPVILGASRPRSRLALLYWV